jgi:hypothetical protein
MSETYRSEISQIRSHAHNGMKECQQVLESCAASGKPMPALLTVIHQPTCNIFTSGADIDQHDCTPVAWWTTGTAPFEADRHPTLPGGN